MARILGWISIFLAGLVLGVLALAFVFAGEIYEYQDTVDGVHLPEVDAIVCLAGGRGRIAAAGDVWYRYWEHGLREKAAASRKPPVLYISGMGPQSNWNVFAKNVRRGVLEVIQPENVVLETESFNTDANARWVVRYARERGWKRILLMTSPYHMRRAKMIFENVVTKSGQPMEVDTLSVFLEPFEPGEWRSGLHGIRVTVTEYVKWLYYRTFWDAPGV
jgi:uncharacterized SAM-binding protein YcdF (DUF218 family)